MNMNAFNNAPVQAGAPVCVIAVFALAARLSARKLVKYPYDAADYTLVLGWLCAWAMAAIIFAEIPYGLGRHTEALVSPEETLSKFLKLYFSSEITYICAITLIKISILLLYRSIFQRPHFLNATYVVGALCILWAIACMFVSIFGCNPVQDFWDTSIEAPNCISTRTYFLGNSIPNIALDVMILSLPMYEIYQLQKMQLKIKVIVGGMFALGGFVCIISGLRLHYLLGMNEDDITFTYLNEAAWSIVELQTAVICACLPTLRPLFRYFGHAVTHHSSSSSKGWRIKEHNALDVEEQILNGAGSKSPTTGHWEHSEHSIQMPERGRHQSKNATLREELEMGVS